MLPLRHRRLWVAMSAVLVAAVVYGSLTPHLVLPVPGNFDKVEHFSAYCTLALWFTGLFRRTGYWKVAVSLLGLGLSMEILQGLMHMGRSAEALDMVANTVGVAAGLAVAVVLTGGWAGRVEAWLSST
jgi:VanZ family protein